MPRFEEYPLLPDGQQVPNGAIFLFADPTDLDGDGDPRTKRIPAERLPNYGVTPVVTDVEPNAFGATMLPDGMKTGDVVNLDGPASSAILSVLFSGGATALPPEGAVIIFRNEKAGTAVTVTHAPNDRVYLLEGQDVVLEGDRKAFISFYVRRFASPVFFELRQIGGGYY
jgi:hypothetical protein